MITHEDIRYAVLDALLKALENSVNEVIMEPLPPSAARFVEELSIRLENEDIPFIVRNERILRDVGKPDIEVLGGALLVEIKVHPREFKEGKEQLERYISKYYGDLVKFAILTNGLFWKIFSVENKKLVPVGDIQGNENAYKSENLEKTITPQIREKLEEIFREILITGVSYSATPDNIRKVFYPVLLNEPILESIFDEIGMRDDPLFKSYQDVISKAYGGERENFEELSKKLFIRHTILQMIVNAILTRVLIGNIDEIKACSGSEIGIDISLPHLRWWIRALKTDNDLLKKSIADIVHEIVLKSSLFEWSEDEEVDVFRELYEVFINESTRRKLGEYYTPWWLIEYIVNHTPNLKGKLVLDPACGSGGFLVKAFYKKIQDGETPDEAISSIIGVDINPLAVSIARAELLLAYYRQSGKKRTPLVFWGDFISTIRGSTAPTEELRVFEKKADAFEFNFYAIKSSSVPSLLMRFESFLGRILRNSENQREIDKIKLMVEREIERYVNYLKNKNSAEDKLLKSLLFTIKGLSDYLAKLIGVYGNSVWAVTITSIFFLKVLRKTKPDIIITNPPWIPLASLPDNEWGRIVNGLAREFIREEISQDIKSKTGQIIQGGDLSLLFLKIALDISTKDAFVGFVLPAEQCFYPHNYHGTGRLMIYWIGRKYKLKGKTVYVGDAFGHGIDTSLLIGRKSNEFKLVGMTLKVIRNGSKRRHIYEIEYRESKSGETLQEEAEKIKEYLKFSSEKKIPNGVTYLGKRGASIAPLYGVSGKKGEIERAGLMISIISEDPSRGEYLFKLANVEKTFRALEIDLSEKIAWFVDRPLIYPFSLIRILKALYSPEKSEIQEFLEDLSQEADGISRKKINETTQKVKIPPKPTVNELESLVVYRCMRSFVAAVISSKELEKVVIQAPLILTDHVSYLKTQSTEIAYYYAAVLNYMAHKIQKLKLGFVRDQFARPIMALMNAGLEWKDEEWQGKVAELSKTLHEKVRPIALKTLKLPANLKLYEIVDGGMDLEVKEKITGVNVSKVMKAIENLDEFKELVKVIEEHIDDDIFLEAIKVCTTSK